MDWIQQRNDSYCGLISLLNARIYYGLVAPTYGEIEFEKLIDLGRCRYGSVLEIDKVADRLELKRVIISRNEAEHHFPFEFSSFPPARRSHSALAIGGNKDKWIVINYWCGRGPVVDELTKSDIEFIPVPLGAAGQDFRRFHHIRAID